MITFGPVIAVVGGSLSTPLGNMGKAMAHEFINYAFQNLARKKIKKYAAQYEGVDMAEVLGADDDNFPFLIRQDRNRRDDEPDAFQVMMWNAYNGVMEYTDEDSVRYYATVLYLRAHAYPVFTSFREAEKWVAEHDWCAYSGVTLCFLFFSRRGNPCFFSGVDEATRTNNKV